jgi:hypothetical protein
MSVFYPSLLSYYCSNALVMTDRLTMIRVTYGLLLQCVIVVVHATNQLETSVQNNDVVLFFSLYLKDTHAFCMLWSFLLIMSSKVQ